MKKILVIIAIALVCAFAATAAIAETWQNAQLLNASSETAAKSSRVAGSINGGFHCVYTVQKPSDQLSYRRYQNGSLGSVVSVYGFHFNCDLAEAGNGSIHIVWEDWQREISDNVPIGYAISTNGGSSFSTGYIPHNNTKWPKVAHYGSAGTGTMVVTAGSINYPSSGDNNMNYATYNGSSWSSTSAMTDVLSEYNLEGIDRSPVDGSVWKIYEASDSKLYIRKFNGSSWETPICVQSSAIFRCRHDIAVNSDGQVACVWSDNDTSKMVIYTPGSGVSSVISLSTGQDFMKVTDIPGRTDFYLAYLTKDRKSVEGRLYSQGTLHSPVRINAGMPDGFYPEINIDADSNGVLCAVFEYWPGNDPQQYYTICKDYEMKGTISGTVTSGGVGVSGVVVKAGTASATTNSSGAYTINNLASGTYTVTATKAGFYTATQTGVSVVNNQTTTVNFSLTLRKVKNDYDLDGISDLAYYTPGSQSYFYIKTSSSGFSSSSNYAWGTTTLGDTPMPGDFDWDGKCDLMVYRPGSPSTWWLKKSSSGYSQYTSYNCGQSGDTPLVGDFDGDKKTDIAVYRPGSTSYFIIWKASGNYGSSVSYAWGSSSYNDIPFVADFDGDGKSDFGVYRPGSTATWYIKTSSSNFSSYVYYDWGTTGDIPVAGDFDGDRKADLAIYRAGSTSSWRIQTSSSNFSSYFTRDWGTTGDTAVTSDFDGDGMTDITVYRPGSPSIWWVLKSSNGYVNDGTDYSFGGSNDSVVGSAAQQPYAF